MTSLPQDPLEVCRGAAAAAAAVPAGRWAVGVSGGADSVALLLLLRARPELSLHVVHLDHETRAGASAEDARFVRDLAGRLKLPCTIERRSHVEPALDVSPPNPSARYRAARLALFRRVVRDHGLAGVVLAHHADDQAETVLHRLLRGSGPAGLAGMSARASVGGLTIVRPLLGVRGATLRAVLRERGETWREDASNASDVYVRNRLRRVLATGPELTHLLLKLAAACRRWREWLELNTPAPPMRLPAAEVVALPAPLQREFARRWLVKVGVPPERLEPPVVHRLIMMANDAATPARQQFPGEVFVRRSRGMLTAQPGPAKPVARRGTSGTPNRAEEVRPSSG